MEIRADMIIGIEEISVPDFNREQINHIKKEYGGLRQESKAPT